MRIWREPILHTRHRSLVRNSRSERLSPCHTEGLGTKRHLKMSSSLRHIWERAESWKFKHSLKAAHIQQNYIVSSSFIDPMVKYHRTRMKYPRLCSISTSLCTPRILKLLHFEAQAMGKYVT